MQVVVMQSIRYRERRRITRLSLQVPLTVRCRLPEGETIDLKASTYIVSAHGALVLMDTPLIPGQTVKVLNEHTAKSVDCVVTSLRRSEKDDSWAWPSSILMSTSGTSYSPSPAPAKLSVL